MFKEERTTSNFEWSMLGDVASGRPHLGPMCSVLAYRLMQFTLRDTLVCELGVEKTDQIFYSTGELAGREFYKNVITKKASLEDFIAELEESLRNMNVGILKVESADIEKFTFKLTVAEDLDCSGLPACNEEICTYDEGFISGILSEHTGRKLSVKEIDCWCSGERVCRFEVLPA